MPEENSVEDCHEICGPNCVKRFGESMNHVKI